LPAKTLPGVAFFVFSRQLLVIEMYFSDSPPDKKAAEQVKAKLDKRQCGAKGFYLLHLRHDLWNSKKNPHPHEDQYAPIDDLEKKFPLYFHAGLFTHDSDCC
jgi:hypothetical protein